MSDTLNAEILENARRSLAAMAGSARVSRTFLGWKSDGRILGIIDYYGAVHSRVAKSGEDHDKHFGWRMNKCWSFEDGRLWHGYLEADDRDAIERHLKRKYSIRMNATREPRSPAGA